MKNNIHAIKIIIIVAIGLMLLLFIGAVAYIDRSEAPAETSVAEDYEVDLSDVTMEMIPNGILNGPIYIDIVTNLEPGKLLMLNMQDEDGFMYHEQIVVLEDGIAHSSAITDNGEHLKGNYDIVITEPEHDEIVYLKTEYKFS